MIAAYGLAAGNDPMWPVYLLAAATVLYAVFRPIIRRRKDPLEQLPRMGLSQQRAVEREMSSLLVELSQMARQLTAQLDTRAAKLEALINQAEQRIAELRQLGVETGEQSGAAAPEVLPHADPGHSGQHEPVYLLADQGRSVQEIARQLGRPRGEIELILALRPRESGRAVGSPG